MSSREVPLGSKYILGEEIGRGAQASVYKAIRRSDKAVFAAKLIRTDVDSSSLVIDYFLKERRSLERVRHPNVVEMVDTVVDDGRLAIIMQYVAGSDLSRLVKSRSLSLDEVLNLAMPIGDGLDAIHRSGVVHRDLKPANVLLSDSKERLDPKISDFGISRLIDATSSSIPRVIGTPMYMAPEVSAGARAGFPADIYSFGVLLFEMIAGRPPFFREGIDQYGLAHRYESPPRLDNVPPHLADLVERMLAKDPASRPSCEEVRRRLHLLASDRSHVETVPPTGWGVRRLSWADSEAAETTEQRWRWLSRLRMRRTNAVALMGLAVIAAVGMTWALTSRDDTAVVEGDGSPGVSRIASGPVSSGELGQAPAMAASLLMNGSFTEGLDGWETHSREVGRTTANAVAGGLDPGNYLEVTSTQPYGSIYQDVAIAVEAGHTYRLCGSVRSASGVMAAGSLALFGISPAPNYSDERGLSEFMVDGSWKLVCTTLSPSRDHTKLRAEMYVAEPSNAILLDQTTLVRSLIMNGSFEVDTRGWIITGATDSEGQTTILAGGIDGNAYLEIEVARAGTVLQQEISVAANKGSYSLCAWVRSPVGRPVEGSLILREVSSRQPGPGVTKFVAEGTWAEICASWTSSEGTRTLLAEVHMSTERATYNFDQIVLN